MDVEIAQLDDEPIISLRLTTKERQTMRYSWAEVCFNPIVASEADRSSDDFKRGFSWYASFRWFLGKKNTFLDKMLDDEGLQPEQVSKKEYALNRRTWVKWIRKYDW